MKQAPTLRTARLTLRPFTMEDAPAVQGMVSAREIALNTLLIPHPYPEGGAEVWIAKHGEDFAEIGYWVGMPFWGRGYASEAAAEVVRYGFEECGLQRIFACHFTRNPASGRVLQKAGMQYEGTLRRHLVKWGEPVDLAFYGVLREEWELTR